MSRVTAEVETGGVTAQPALEGLSLMDPDYLRDPAPYLARMRPESPVLVAEASGVPIWIVATDELCREVLEDPATYSSRFSLQPKPSPEVAVRTEQLRAEMGGYPRVRTLIVEDPPRHDRYRKLVGTAFTPRAMAGWQEAFDELATRLVDEFNGASRVDFRNAFALPMSVRSVAMILDLPESILADFSRWSDDTIIGLGTEVTDEQYLEAQRSITEFQLYFADVVAQRRAHPTDDLATRLVNARMPAGGDPGQDMSPLSDPEILDLLQSIVAAANHTTTSAMTEMVLQLSRNPRWWKQACVDPDTWPAIIEESVRLASPANGLWRVATRETELGGVRIPARGKVFVSFASATRDEALFDHADEFDPARNNVAGHLGFGRGDYGRQADDGFVFFVDRKKQAIRRRGENISSIEVENAIRAHESIRDVAVHAVPSGMTEDEVKAVLVLVEGGSVDPAQLFDFPRETLPYFAVPRYIEIRSELPVNAVGRVMKHILKEEGVTPATWDFTAMGLVVDKADRR
jgi:cytochrome P450